MPKVPIKSLILAASQLTNRNMQANPVATNLISALIKVLPRVWTEWLPKSTWNVNQASKATRQSPMDISFQFIFFCFIPFAPFPCLFSV